MPLTYIGSRLRAVLDANVLVKSKLIDLLLKLAETCGLFLPLWSSQILDEVERTHRKFGWEAHLIQSFRFALENNLSSSMVRGYEHWIGQCTNDEGDRHVLACAIEAKASVIVTENLRHFKANALTPWGIRALHPQEFLLELYRHSPYAVWERLEAMAEKDESGVRVILRTLATQVPNFSQTLLAQLDS